RRYRRDAVLAPGPEGARLGAVVEHRLQVPGGVVVEAAALLTVVAEEGVGRVAALHLQQVAAAVRHVRRGRPQARVHPVDDPGRADARTGSFEQQVQLVVVAVEEGALAWVGLPASVGGDRRFTGAGSSGPGGDRHVLGLDPALVGPGEAG